MTERLEPRSSASGRARRRTPLSRAGRARRGETIPVPTPPDVSVQGEPTLLGFPAEFADDDGAAEPAGDPSPDNAPGLTVLRRTDPVGAGILVLAGVAANVSLLLSWSPGDGPTGLALVQRGVEAARSGPLAFSGSFWQPPVVVLSGGLLILLGLLLLVAARTHRLVGLLALVVALTAATAVVLLIVQSGLVDDRFGPGMWCAVAVPVLGALGSLKAMLTLPVVTLDDDTSPPSDRMAALEL